jgi:N-acetylglucosaminylphosphatidylinositol deacetylase
MILWLWIWIWVSATLTSLNPAMNGKVLLLTAHPDDEVMFFSPTLLALDPQDVHVVCLSEGQGEGRVKELKESLSWIGIEQVHVVDDDRLKDSMELYWNPRLIADLIRPFVSKLDISTVTIVFS